MKNIILALLLPVLAIQSLYSCEWISFKDEFPPENEQCLFWDKTTGEACFGFIGEVIFFYAIYEDTSVEITHWMRVKPPQP